MSSREGRLDSDSIGAFISRPNRRREMRHDRCPFASFAIRKPAPRKSLRAMRQADRRAGMVRNGAAPHLLFMEMPGLRLPVRGGGVLRSAVRGHRGLRNQPPDRALVGGIRINLVRRGEMLTDAMT